MPFRVLRIAVTVIGFMALLCWALTFVRWWPLLSALHVAAVLAGLWLGVRSRGRSWHNVEAVAGLAPTLLVATALFVFLPFGGALWYVVGYVLWPVVGAAFGYILVRSTLARLHGARASAGGFRAHGGSK